MCHSIAGLFLAAISMILPHELIGRVIRVASGQALTTATGRGSVRSCQPLVPFPGRRRSKSLSPRLTNYHNKAKVLCHIWMSSHTYTKSMCKINFSFDTHLGTAFARRMLWQHRKVALCCARRWRGGGGAAAAAAAPTPTPGQVIESGHCAYTILHLHTIRPADALQ